MTENSPGDEAQPQEQPQVITASGGLTLPLPGAEVPAGDGEDGDGEQPAL